MYALVEDNCVNSECKKQRVMFGKLVPNFSDEELKELGILPVRERVPSFDSLTEEIKQTHWSIENNIAFKCWEVSKKDPSIVRKHLESQATVVFKDTLIEANDKAVAMLQGYIGSSKNTVQWRGVDEFVELNKKEMRILLDMILDTKSSLFYTEAADSKKHKNKDG